MGWGRLGEAGSTAHRESAAPAGSCQGWVSCLESSESKTPQQPRLLHVSVAAASATREVPWA